MGTLDRPWISDRADAMAAARKKMAVAFEFFEKLGVPVLLLPRPRRRAARATRSRTFRANLDALADDAAGYQERTGVRLLWGTANLFSHPRYQAGAATNPDPEVFAYAAAQVKHMLEVTQRLGGAELRPVGRPRGLRHAAQHGPPARGRPARALPAPRRRAQAPDRLRRAAPDRAQADGADQAPVRLRRRDRPRLPRPPRPRGRVPGQHRGEPRDARRPQLPPRGRVAVAHGHPRQHRRQPRRPAERLGHRPVPELGRGPRRSRCTRSSAPAASRPAASTSTPSCAARASTGRTCSTPTSAASTRWRGRCSSRPTLHRGRGARRAQGRAATRAGTARSGRRSSAAREPRRPRGARGRRPRSTRGRRPAARSSLENLVNQRDLVGRPASGGVTRWRSSSGSTSRRPRPRPSSSTSRAWCVGDRRGRVRVRASRGRSGASRIPALWWDGPSAAIRSALADAGIAGDDVAAVGLTGQMHGRSCSTRRRRAPAGDPVERPADGGGVRRDPRSGRAERLIEITGNDALTGFTAPKLVWVRDHEPDDLGAGRARPAAQGLRAAAPDRRLRAGQGRRRGHAAVRPRGAGLVAGGPRRAPDRSGVAATDLRGAGGHRASSPRPRPRRPACVPARRSWPGGGDQAANAVGVGAIEPGHGGAVARHVGRRLRDDRRHRCASRPAASTPSATPCPAAGT